MSPRCLITLSKDECVQAIWKALNICNQDERVKEYFYNDLDSY